FDGPALASRLRCADGQAARILEHWLAGVYAVDSLEPWLNTRLPEGVTLVARDGTQLSARELTLFAPDARTHGALERQREIESLSGEVGRLDEEQALCRDTADEAEVALQTAQAALASVRARIGQLRQQAHAAQLEVVRVQQAKARHEERLAQFRREAEEIAAAEETERGHLIEAEEARELHLQRSEQLSEDLNAAQQDVTQREQALRAQRDRLQGFQRAAQEAEFSMRECASKLDDIGRNDSLTSDQLSRGASELAQLIAERDGLDEESLQVSLSTALDLRDAREAALAARRDEMERASNTLREQDAERLRCERALDPLREQLNALRLAHQAAELAYQQACERLEEMQAANATFAAEELAQVKELSLTREVARIQREIADLGAVNLAALTELTAASERKGFLDAQNDDLTQAIETLEDAIRRIDRETREQLMETYNTVNRHFGELFPRLFGGGEAALVLTGDEILDAGVQIVARPPGKKNSSIHLLSGGEKALTAIALVFSMFQLNPAPFCMLDEVDAPLDDANTERYCDMVKHMSSVTQFVFISHSKITMEMAQQLIGVTMQEQGVSRVVEVDMDEAMRLAQPEAA
ncbi:MAG: chromosome segregation protein SMC, partial [Rhodocyclaceae bacterium]